MASSEKAAIVTGAGTGIGRSVALAFLKDGYRVALAGRRKDMLEETAKLSGAGERALVVATDVTDQKAVRALFAAAHAKFGRLDVLFNNADQHARQDHVQDLTLERAAVVNTNLRQFLCTQEAVKIMKSQTPRGGCIINNGSIRRTPRPDSAPTPRPHAVGAHRRRARRRKYDIRVARSTSATRARRSPRAWRTAFPRRTERDQAEPLMRWTTWRGGAPRQTVARDQRAVPHHHGDQRCLHRARMMQLRPTTRWPCWPGRRGAFYAAS